MISRRRSICLTDSIDRVDLYDRSRWNDLLDDDESKLGQLVGATRELPNIDANIPLAAVWGFDLRRRSLRIFHGRSSLEKDCVSCVYLDRRNGLEEFLKLGFRLMEFCSTRPSLIELEQGLRASEQTSIARKRGMELRKFIRTLNSELVLHWCRFDQFVLAGLFEVRALLAQEKSGSSAPQDVAAESRVSARSVVEKNTLSLFTMRRMDNDLAKFYDYYWLKGQVWHSVPQTLFCLDNNAETELLKIFSDPFAFDPRSVVPDDVFLWPWQKCLQYDPNNNVSAVNYRTIPTASLVLDLRASTIAMDLTNDASAYAEFIEVVVSKSKEVVLSHGGFFDKETGDGIVGHFCDMSTSGEKQGAELDQFLENAVEAAANIIRTISEICNNFQPLLSHGLDGLGPAVGIHIDSAVWVITGGQIRAIGSSVVGASRLCAVAQNREIVISNAALNKLRLGSSYSIERNFGKRQIIAKEYRDSVGLYAFGWVVL